MYCYVWEFTVRSEKLGEFETSYGAEGEWVRLFRQDPEYVRTLLLRDREAPARYLTLDFWTSREACEAFRERFRYEFEALDARFEAWTLRETYLGAFDVAA